MIHALSTLAGPTRVPLGLALLAGASASCSDSTSHAGETPAEAEGELVVFVVNHPLESLARRIGGERVRVELPAPADVDPAFWSPEAETILRYQEADLVLRNGAGYASWIDRASLAPSRIVDTSAGFTERLLSVPGSVTHAHGPEGDHTHADTAFTTWLDPTLALEQGRAVLAAFQGARPTYAAEFQERFDALEAELLALDARLSAIVARDPELPLLASHPVYQYLAGRYDLDLVSLHWEPDELPDAAAWRELERVRAEHPAAWMLWEGEPLAETRSGLAERSVECILFEPAGNRPSTGDFLDTMERNAAELERAYEGR